MTYDEALRFWFARVNYEQRSPLPSDLKLDRMRALLECLGNPQNALRIVHVAGSKGKGSTSAMLAAILRCAGYRVGLFTSPHLSQTEERIQVDGQLITRPELAALMDDIRPCVEAVDRRRAEGAVGVTFFEIATALGFLHFLRRRVDVAVVEVGLGGRFDSTNVCCPMVSVITSISLDHVQQLGPTLTSIAMEKAGIVKSGRPVVSGARDSEARAVIKGFAHARHAPLRQMDVDFHFEHLPGEVSTASFKPPRVRVATARRNWPEVELGLLGEHQAANCALAVATTEVLQEQGLTISDNAVARGLATVQWPGRMEVVSRQPLVILDCAHNVASALALVKALAESFPLQDGRRFLVFAGSSDKDLAGMLEVLATHFDQAFLTRYAISPRSAAPAELLALWQRATDRPAETTATASHALQLARSLARPMDLICVTGSVFLVGEVRRELLQGSP